jgi:hypothetical protein
MAHQNGNIWIGRQIEVGKSDIHQPLGRIHGRRRRNWHIGKSGHGKSVLENAPSLAAAIPHA